MGNVSARDMPYGHDDSQDDGPAVSLDGIAARVTRVQVKGLVRTKDDMVVDSIEPVLKVKHFEELVLAAQDARNRLHDLGCFDGVEVEIDTCTGGGNSDYEVTFAVQESRRVKGSINTMVGNQEGSLMFGAKMPNLLGRGELAKLNYSHGTKKTNQFDASFMKPIKGGSFQTSESPFIAFLTGTLFQSYNESLPSGYKECGRGSMLDLSFNSSPQIAHNLQLEQQWRHLSVLSGSSAFCVREHSGHTLKSSLRHILTVDRRDNPIFPNEGSLFKISQEFSGLGFGDIGFFKNEVEAQANLPLNTLGWVLQTSFQCGYLKPLDTREKTVTLSDKFYLGGPLNVRGFEMRGLGPSSENNAIGGTMYWATGLHLYTPLPFRNTNPDGGPSFSNLFRTHTFINAGNLLGTFNPTEGVSRNLDQAIQNFRLSYGLGLALKLGGIARIELNYCFPLRSQKGDRVSPGIQLGVGVNFL